MMTCSVDGWKGWRVGGWLALPLLAWLFLWTPATPWAQDTAGATTDDKLKALVEVLEDEQARAALVDKLNALAGESEAPAETAKTTSIARQVAVVTQTAAEDVSSLFGRIWQDVLGIRDLIGSGDLDLGKAIEASQGLIGVIASTFLVLLVLRMLLRPLFGRMAVQASKNGLVGSVLWLVASIVIDAVSVLIAYGCGYGIALGVFGEAGRIGVDQSLFLNAFLLVELVKTALRGGIAPRFAALRFLPIEDRTAGFAYGRSAAIASIVGYGALVAAPLANAGISNAFGRAITVIALIIALVLALHGIWKLKRLLAEEAVAHGDEDDITGRALALLDRIWPWLASLYVIGVFVIAISRPAAVLPYVLGATARSALAIVVGVGLTVLIGRSIRKGVPLPSSLRSSMPQLKGRLDRVVPTLLKVIRLIVLIAVVLTVVDAWGIVDVGGWLTSEGGESMVGAFASVALVILLAYLVWLAAMSWIEYRLSGNGSHVASARARTLLSLFGNAITIALAVLAVMLVLSELGIDIGPLLAGAGVVGLAVGFGAQKLVQDIITGVFIQFENAINTGDVVTVAGTTGTVERLSVRSIGIRDVSGTYHLIPFSAVDQVSNFNRGFAYHVADIGIAYKESVPEAKEAMQAAFDRLKATELADDLRDDLELLGVQALGDSAVVVRGRIKTAPGRQWAIGRAYNELVKEVFDERGIDIPFPHMTVYMGTDKDGHTQLAGLLARQSGSAAVS